MIMKHVLIYFSAVLLLAMGLPACKEVGPQIDLGGNSGSVSDTTYVEFPVQAMTPKVVMMEEFTGVRCINCPEGHDIISNLKDQNPDRFVYASFHSKFLSNPYSFSPIDFRSTEAQEMEDYLISVGYKPAAAIDRKVFDATVLPSVLYGRQTWSNYLSQQLTQTSPVNIEIDKTYNETNRQLEVTVSIHYTQLVSVANKVTLLLTEDSLVSPQVGLNDVLDTFYVHNGVFRKFLTPTRGDLLDAEKVPGRVFKRVYQTLVDANWSPDKMNIIAYVHEFEDNSKLIYQARKVKVKD